MVVATVVLRKPQSAAPNDGPVGLRSTETGSEKRAKLLEAAVVFMTASFRIELSYGSVR